MALIDKKSMLDKNFKGVEGNPVGQNPPNAGNFHTENGASNSPFDNEDHLKALLEDNIVNSQNSGNTYDPSLMVGNQPGPPAVDQDFDGLQGSQFQKSKSAASSVHESSLALVPKSPSNSPFQDRMDDSGESTPSG